MEKSKILVLFFVVLFGVLVTGMIVSYFLDTYPPLLTEMNDYDVYIEKVYNADTFMPNLDDLPTYEGVEVYYDNRASKSITLSIKFLSENYEEAKETILKQFAFLDRPLQDETGFYYIPEYEFSFNSYNINVVDNEEFSYPENFGMIGFSDEHSRICFLFFYDRSLNELGTGYEMVEFVDNNFIFPED